MWKACVNIKYVGKYISSAITETYGKSSRSQLREGFHRFSRAHGFKTLTGGNKRCVADQGMRVSQTSHDENDLPLITLNIK